MERKSEGMDRDFYFNFFKGLSGWEEKLGRRTQEISKQEQSIKASRAIQQSEFRKEEIIVGETEGAERIGCFGVLQSCGKWETSYPKDGNPVRFWECICRKQGVVREVTVSSLRYGVKVTLIRVFPLNS